MILEFSIKNFRSIKERQTLSLTAEGGKSKEDNTFEINFANGTNERLLKSAILYGANASGKSNIIRGFYYLLEMIQTSTDLKVDENIPYYEPFLFDVNSRNQPVTFELLFVIERKVGPVKFKYLVELTSKEILREELDYYPKNQKNTLFKRVAKKNEFELIHKVKLGKNGGSKNYDIFSNQLLLSRFGKDYPHELLSNVYRYFLNLTVWNATNKIRTNSLKNEVAEELLSSKNEHLKQRLAKLLRIADTRIENFQINRSEESDFKFPEGFSEELKQNIIKENRNRVLTSHKLFDGKSSIGLATLDLNQESEGTIVLFALGGLILRKLVMGGIVFFDELDNSLHPRLSKFLVRLFNNPISNPLNAQLVVASHEVTLLDKDTFRKDQIWFTEKDKFGATVLYSAKDFEGVREDTPFDKWYMSGKFGGNPKIKEVEFIFGNE